VTWFLAMTQVASAHSPFQNGSQEFGDRSSGEKALLGADGKMDVFHM
jgi:hypothetical protein